MSLFAACAYAAFAHGAIRSPDEPRLQVGVAVIAALAAGAGLWFGGLSLRAPRLARLALALLFAFTAWSAITLAWSASPDGTWTEVNRTFTYVLVLGLAISFGTSVANAISLTRRGLLALTLAVSVYALAQKLIPGFHIAGIIDLDQTGALARLQAPLDYWNALALFVTLGAPAALTLALAPQASRPARLTGLIGLELITATVGFSESRGGLLALAVAMALTVALSPDRLTTLMWVGAGLGAGVLDLVIGLTAHPLTADGVALGRRELAGLYLLIVLVAVAVLSALALDGLDGLAARLTPPRRRVIWRGLGAAGALLVLVAIVAAALSHRGLGGQISHLWTGFNRADSIATSSAGRLFSDSSANRVDWWGQALAAFAKRPLGGYGAGSFPVIDLLFRHDTVRVQDAHSVPLQWLAETGIVGALLVLAAWGALLSSGVIAVRRAGRDRRVPLALDSPAARHRLAAAALLAPALAYSVHALYDWDWDIPGVTLPVLVILGVLAGSLAHPALGAGAVVLERPQVRLQPRVSATTRLTVLALFTVLLCLFAISAVLPGVAATKAEAALIAAAQGTPQALVRARHDASYASALDPLSGAGPLASANVALAQQDDSLARDYLITAVRREPTDEQAWDTLIRVDLDLGRDAEAIHAAERVLALDPVMSVSGRLAISDDAIAAQVAAAPPTDSATALPTPGG